MAAAVDAQVVARLLREQAPELAAERVRPVAASGSSNWVFRVGETHAVRVPRTESAARELLKEARWLPRLAPQLPVPVPEVVHVGTPSASFAHPWTLVRWVPGEPPGTLGPTEQDMLARTLGGFLRSLHAVRADGQAVGAEHWGYRAGEPVTATADAWVEEAAADLADLFDPDRVREAWRVVRRVPPASMPSCWVHTDLSAENLLVGPDGALAGVIDFGGLGVGDRSVDLLYAWSMLDRPARETFRDAAGVDRATWLRARAWAFAGPGLLTIAHYRDTMPARTARLTRMVEAVAREVDVALR